MKTKEITPKLFDCDIVRKERMKLYMEMAEHFKLVMPKYGMCMYITRKAELFDAYPEYAEGNPLTDNLPELKWIEPKEGIGGWWFEDTEQGQLERSTALLFVYYAMGGK